MSGRPKGRYLDSIRGALLSTIVTIAHRSHGFNLLAQGGDIGII